ncbi:hypothetical protein DC522_05735 [Microvirga sp. KLBC 81]|uniref:hypothetical protein n=1 Tax=Microvirga sp. KLBC 81 TaxID=1862707 RepID=UPI000D51EB63|nr:hypothetical protein [Microvirga sp. KLBC 81]PVE25398.1 hypothetical protein DC522_05735 [Microvirga sp. KLBC 81]
MARFQHPAVHDVEKVSASVMTLSTDHCVTLKFEGRDYFGDPSEAEFRVFIPLIHTEYAHALAAAINAVPVPEKNEDAA